MAKRKVGAYVNTHQHQHQYQPQQYEHIILALSYNDTHIRSNRKTCKFLFVTPNDNFIPAKVDVVITLITYQMQTSI